MAELASMANHVTWSRSGRAKARPATSVEIRRASAEECAAIEYAVHRHRRLTACTS